MDDLCLGSKSVGTAGMCNWKSTGTGKCLLNCPNTLSVSDKMWTDSASGPGDELAVGVQESKLCNLDVL